LASQLIRRALSLLFHSKERSCATGKEVSVWYDKEADFLEVFFERKEGYFRETDNDAVMEKVDKDGNVLGFSILKVSGLESGKPISVILKTQAA
jgi:uncharacterized protein YuzE